MKILNRHNLINLLTAGFTSLAVIMTSACGRIDGNLRVAASETDSTAESFAKKIAKAYDSDSKKLVLRNTTGSAGSLRLLNDDIFDLAVVNSSVIADAFHREGEFEGFDDDLDFGVIAALSTEVCHIIVPAQSEIKRVHDFIGKKVAVGVKDSSTYVDAEQILDSDGLDFEKIIPCYLDDDDAIEAIKKGEIEAAFISAPIPSESVKKLCDEMEIRFIGIDSGDVKNIIMDNSGYSSVSIPKDTYKGQDSALTLPGSQVVIAANLYLDDKTVKDITSLIVKHFYLDNLDKNAQDYQQKLGQALDRATLKELNLPFHEAAFEFYQKLGTDLLKAEHKQRFIERITAKEVKDE